MVLASWRMALTVSSHARMLTLGTYLVLVRGAMSIW